MHYWALSMHPPVLVNACANTVIWVFFCPLKRSVGKSFLLCWQGCGVRDRSSAALQTLMSTSVLWTLCVPCVQVRGGRFTSRSLKWEAGSGGCCPSASGWYSWMAVPRVTILQPIPNALWNPLLRYWLCFHEDFLQIYHVSCVTQTCDHYLAKKPWRFKI